MSCGCGGSCCGGSWVDSCYSTADGAGSEGGVVYAMSADAGGTGGGSEPTPVAPAILVWLSDWWHVLLLVVLTLWWTDR